MTCNGKAVSKVMRWGMIEITGRSDCLMCKNGEIYVIDFACVESCHLSIRHLLHNLTDMRQKPSAGLGLHVAMVPESYHHIPHEAKMQKIQDWPIPKDVTGVRGFLSTCRLPSHQHLLLDLSPFSYS
jgi:hypothetical protein